MISFLLNNPFALTLKEEVRRWCFFLLTSSFSCAEVSFKPEPAADGERVTEQDDFCRAVLTSRSSLFSFHLRKGVVL